MLSGCKDNNPVNNTPPCGGIDPGIVPEPAYDSPIWHPGGRQFIGFNHVPLNSISYPYGEGCWGEQHFNRDSSGFWIINPDGTNMHRIFPYTLQDPAWSPDGNWVAFVAGGQIYKMRFTGTTFDTTTLVQLTAQGSNFFPDWSPDGQWITYNESVCEGVNTCGIWLMKSNGTQFTFLAPYGNFPNWYLQGKKILYRTRAVTPDGNVIGDSLWLLNIELNEKDFFLFLGDNNFKNSYFKYSPDGADVAFTSQPNGGQPQIWLMNSDGSDKNKLTSTGVDATFGLPFSWSPDGSSIVYTDYRFNDWTYDNGTLWILDPVSGGKRQLTFNPKPAE